ncbi:MAG: glycerophosphodiester phosphodiesterase family protein [Roseovarius sp.]|uniref:glycerophosphodiester phosphodiesterase family protein n=1 Tax=Roseovarius sp. TaxID=1486281 RepID=UPI0032ED3D71
MSGLPESFLRLPIAHRALHDVADGRPENSRAAIEAAIAAGYGIEIDLQLSLDGRAMVFHDYDLGRLTGDKGPIRQREAAELSRIGLLGGQEGVPSFAEVLELVDGRVPLLVELKDQHGQMGETDGALEQATAADLQGYDGPLALMSFNPHMVVRMAELAPEWPRGIVSCGFRAMDWPLLKVATRRRLREIPDYEAAGCSFISHHAPDLGRDRVTALKAGGAAVLCWTIQTPEAEAEARQVADNVTFEGYRAAIPA